MKLPSHFISLTLAALSTGLLGAVAGEHIAALDTLEKRQDAGHWVAAWTSMPQLVEPNNMPPSPFSSPTVLKNATLRQTFYITLSSPKIKIAFSNTFGGSDLPITSASVGLPLNGAAGVSGIQASPIAAVTVGGKSSFVVKRGEVVVSDEIAFEVKAMTNIAVSVYSKEGQSGSSITGHPGSRTTSWFKAGEGVNSTALGGTASVHWYFVSAVHAYVPSTTSAVAILGDSITDGRGSDDNKNNRWPDLVLARMNAANITNISLLNQAAGGNCVLKQCLGPSTISRYTRDALTQPGVKYVMIFEGVNDIGNEATSSSSQSALGDSLIRAYTTIISDARKAGFKTIGGTITPFGAPSSGQQAYSDPNREATRQKVNKWILTKGNFDYVVDFSAAIESKTSKGQIDSKYHGGDYLHPNAAGYRAMAEAFPLEIFGM